MIIHLMILILNSRTSFRFSDDETSWDLIQKGMMDATGVDVP